MSPSSAPERGTAPIPDLALEGGTLAIFRSEASRKLLAMVQRVAPYPTAVLIAGETGSGKEIIARGIHSFSLRHNKPLIDVNCAAIPEHLIESELFGYDKGAFSGADTTKPGFFEMANEGTLFLDEIGELDARVQVKLLRVLDGASYFRLGGNKKVSVNVRILAATNRELERDVEAGRFRRDLYHRLSQIQLRVPPLRERLEDIEVLALHYLREHKPSAAITPQAMACLRNYLWPGNIRELRNVMVNAAVISEGEAPQIDVGDLPAAMRPEHGARPAPPSGNEPGGELEQMERRMILQALQQHSGDHSKAADQLGISRRTLTRKLKIYEGSPVTVTRESVVLGRAAMRQHQCFRANIDTEVEISLAAEKYVLRSVNVSAGGIGVQGFALDIAGDSELAICFTLPESEVVIRGNGFVSWVDAEHRAGIRFRGIEGFHHLERWIQEQLEREDWEPAVLSPV